MPSAAFNVGDRISFHKKEDDYCDGWPLNEDDIVSGTIVSCCSVKNELSHCAVLLDKDTDYGFPFKRMGGWEDWANLPPDFETRNYLYIHSYRLTAYKDSTSQISQKDNTMAKMMDMVKTDAKEAAYRVAGAQITNGVKTGLVKLFESKGGKSDQMEMLKSLLDTEIGESMIALLLGYGLNYAPGIKNDPRVVKISEEFRIQGMATAGNLVMGAAMESILPVLTSALSALPEETGQLRVSEKSLGSSSEEEEEEEVVPAKTAKTGSR